MRLAVATVALAAFAALACSRSPSTDSIAPAEQAAIEQAVRACHDQTLAAAAALDLDRLFGFVAETDRGSMIGNGRLLLTRADTIAANRQQFQSITALKYEPSERHVTVLSRTAALLVTTGQTRFSTTDGRDLAVPYAQTIVFVFRDGRWQVLHLHSSSPVPR